MSQPGELDSFIVYERIGRAIEAATSLRQMPDDLVGGRLYPTQILHRKFRVDPRGMSFPQMKARPSDVVIVRETVAVLMTHNLADDVPRGSYALAAQDFTAVLRALLTRTEISGLAHLTGASRTVRRSERQIDQEFVLNVEYHVTLPAASGPE